MKSKFLEAYKLFMEQISNQYEFENMTLAVVPGSFKPPHKGHWEMVMSYIDKVDKVIVLISNISKTAISNRPLSMTNLKDLGKIKEYIEKNLSNNEELTEKIDSLIEKAETLTFTELETTLNDVMSSDIDNTLKTKIQKYLDRLNNSLFKSIRKTANETEITPEMSKEIFEIFAKAYGVEGKVDVRISQSPSPISATYGLIENNCKDCKVLLGVSKKGGDEQRWNDLKNSEENPTNEIIPSPVDVQTMLSATQLRNRINDLKKEWFPDKLSNEDFEKIKSILNGNEQNANP